jgi:hypothetical protein
MKKSLFMIFFLIRLSLFAQPDTLREVITTVFYDKDVYHKVFSHYPGKGHHNHVLVEGTYAIIGVDSLFASLYPGVTDTLALRSDDAFFTATLIKNTRGNVIIRSRSVFENNMDRFIRIDKFVIKGEKIHFVFHISGQDSFLRDTGKREIVDSKLRFKNGKLAIRKKKMSSKPATG